jgi:Calcineurin-like phosphoesterase
MIAFYADIHYRTAGPPNYWTPPPNLDVEAILLGGDIHYSPDHLAAMLAAIRATQDPDVTLIFVPGNNEYADQELNESRRRYRAAVAGVENAAMLDNETIVLPSGVRVIGSTLWSHIDEAAIPRYQKLMSDHGMQGVDGIRLGDRALTFEDCNAFHAEARIYIEKELRELSPAERRRTVVCTHFWPTARWMNPGDELLGWHENIGTGLDAMISDIGPRYWLCGHLHRTKDLTIGQTDVVANPLAGETADGVNADFRDTLILPTE